MLSGLGYNIKKIWLFFAIKVPQYVDCSHLRVILENTAISIHSQQLLTRIPKVAL